MPCACVCQLKCHLTRLTPQANTAATLPWAGPSIAKAISQMSLADINLFGRRRDSRVGTVMPTQSAKDLQAATPSLLVMGPQPDSSSSSERPGQANGEDIYAQSKRRKPTPGPSGNRSHPTAIHDKGRGLEVVRSDLSVPSTTSGEYLVTGMTRDSVTAEELSPDIEDLSASSSLSGLALPLRMMLSGAHGAGPGQPMELLLEEQSSDENNAGPRSSVGVLLDDRDADNSDGDDFA